MKGFKDNVNVSVPSLHEHNFSHQIFTSMDFFQFRPVLCMQMYPKDEMEVKVSDYFRAEPMASAAYGDAYKKYAAFFVPQRILWDNFSDFLSGGGNGRLEFNVPCVTMADFIDIATGFYSVVYNSQHEVDMDAAAIYRNMLDYWSDLGVPVGEFWANDSSDEYDTAKCAAFKWPILEFLACRSIWYYWYRDQNLIGDDVAETYCPKSFDSSGYYSPEIDEQSYRVFNPLLKNLLAPMPVALEKDYFTTAMTEPQRGGAAFIPVELPSEELNPGLYDFTPDQTTITGRISIDKPTGRVGAMNTALQNYRLPADSTKYIGMLDYNAIRLGKALQKYCELHGVAGTGDLQNLLAQWGVAPNPIVFNRPVFLGSFTDRLNLTEVVSPMDNGTTMMGEVATKLNANGNGSFKYNAVEHGYFIVVMVTRPENFYLQGVAREKLHGVLGNGKFDFWTSQFEKTGMQPQYLFELTNEWMWNRGPGSEIDLDPWATIGFQPRYSEDKRRYNKYTGQMSIQSNANKRLCPDYSDSDNLTDQRFFISTDRTMIYGYPPHYRFDRWFNIENPLYDHFEGWIKFDITAKSERNEFAAPLIENKGNDISLPYAGVRM